VGLELPIVSESRTASGAVMAGCYEVSLEPLQGLRPTERIEVGRAACLIEKILAARVWTRPILIEGTSKAVMDGHHRLNAARTLGLACVPCIRLRYGDPRLVLASWREDFVVTPDTSGTQQPAPAAVSETDLNSEIELMKSQDLLEKVVTMCGLQKPISRSRWVRRSSGKACSASRASARLSPAPAMVPRASAGLPRHAAQALASAIRWPARLPLSTEEI